MILSSPAPQFGHRSVKAAEAGKLVGAGAKPVTAEQMELSRLRAENARLKMHVDILKKRPSWRRHVPMARNTGMPTLSGARPWGPFVFGAKSDGSNRQQRRGPRPVSC